jgi:phosphoglycerate dehydrogenase-like enzyme
VVWASAPEAVVWPEARAMVEGGGLEIVRTTMRGADGDVAPDAVSAEVVVSSGLPLDAAVFGRLRRARFVLRPSVGYDDVDVEAATRHGILVANVPDTFIDEVADHALTLILAAIRRLPHMEHLVRAGRWAAGEDPRPASRPVRRLSTMTLGLVGFGSIARLVAARARPFGFRLLACLALAVPPHGHLAPPAAHDRKIDRQHEQAERDHPEPEHGQESQDAEHDQAHADADADRLRLRQMPMTVEDFDLCHAGLP